MLRILTRSVLIALLGGLGTSAYAQTTQTGTISGVVHDATEAVLPGVTVNLTSQAQGFTRSTVTDENGRYVFPAVPVGMYNIEVTLQGFETAQSTNNLVETTKTTAVNFTLKIGALTDVVEVVGETPIVDPTTVTQITRVTRDEFEKLPVGRSYQALMAAAPGVVGTGNANSAGALTSHNIFVIDAVDTTDPVTGTFGTNINFESIQEVSVLTTAAGAEYGRAQGAIVNVVTKSGTNRYEAAFKYIFQNDEWDAQNKTVSETNNASLARVKFDKVNPIYSLAGGGPIIKNRAFFFGTYEKQDNTTPQRQTAGQIPEDFQQTTESKFVNVRGTVQLAPSHTAWVKYHESPTNGIVRNDYWGVTVTGDRAALTAQDQTNESYAAQYSGVIRPNWSVEAAYSDFKIHIDVTTFEAGILNNAPIFNLTDNKYYNGATFDGFVDRPRKQFNIASNWFLSLGQRGHNIKVGYDYQRPESGAQFDRPNRQLYIADNYIQATKTPVFGPNSSRRDYDSGPSISTGNIHAFFARDKFEVTDRISVEAGLRSETQTGASDIGDSTLDVTVLAPRLSGTYDISGDGKTLITASYGRYHASVIQSFSDAFAQVAQIANYDNFVWNGSAFVFSNRVQISGAGSGFSPNLDLKPSHVDESTIGFQRQIGRYMGAGVRYIHRTWGNLIDDILTFNPNNTLNREVVNYDVARRKYDGVQFTAEKRFSNNWNAAASYTYSRTRGNHFENTFTTLGDYIDANCRTTVDLTVGSNGLLPCAEVQDGANKYGYASYDRPHNFKMAGAYIRPIGPINLSVGATTEALSKFRYQKERTVNVLLPGTLTNHGATATYYYNERGDDPLDGMEWVLDTAIETTWRIAGTHQAGIKAEIFNLTDRQEKLRSNNVVWCGSAAGTGCQAAIDNFGKATSRTSFRGGLSGTFPRAYRFSLIFRF